MRIVATALGLSAILAASCASSGQSENEENSNAPEGASSEQTTREVKAPEYELVNDLDPAASAASPTPTGAGVASQDDQDDQAGSGTIDLRQEAAELTLREQKKAFLVERHLENARQRMERLELEAAEREALGALELDPDNIDAKRLYNEIGVLMGRSEAELANALQGFDDTYQLKRQQAEAEARNNVQKAKLLLSRGEYDAAITELVLAVDIVTLSPYSGEWQEIETEARALLDQARTERDAAAAAAREEAQKRTMDELREKEQAEQERSRRVVASLLDEAISSFRAQRYDDAIDSAERVLRLDPRNERALEIKDTAFRAERELVAREQLVNKREQYARWQEEMDRLRITNQDVLTLPDEDYWRDITEKRARRPGLDLSQNVSASEIELRQELASTTLPGLSVDQEESLTTVVNLIQVTTGLPLVVDPAAETAAFDEGAVFNFSLTNPLTAEKALNLVTETAGPEVTWAIKHDAVLVTTNEKARGELVTYNHDVQDLIFGLTDFLGPRINRLRLLDDLEDEDGGTPFGAIGEKPTINEPDELQTLVQENVATGTWDGDGVAITIEGGNMVVVQTPEVQLQIRSFLEELRRFSSSLVTIESKFLVIREGFLQEIGVDFRGLDNSGSPFTDLDDLNLNEDPTLGLDNAGTGLTLTPPSAGAFLDEGGDGDIKGRTENFFNDTLGSALSNIGGLTAQWTFLNDLQLSAIFTMVEKSQNVELINDQVLSVYNTQRAYVTVVNQRAYVQDFDVEVAQFQAIADPQVNVLTEGIVLDVRPTINYNRTYLTLEIQPTVAQVVSLTDFSTTLAGQTAAVTFQLPELQVQSVFSTVVVPDGGSILIGGLSRLRNVERRAEVPWLANIPLVGFFFKEEGYSDERESLMILIQAWITDMKEELAKHTER